MPMEFNNDPKTGLKTEISQRVPEIYHYPHRNPHKLKILISITTAFLASSEAQIPMVPKSQKQPSWKPH
jgi:hypothetical protein